MMSRTFRAGAALALAIPGAAHAQIAPTVVSADDPVERLGVAIRRLAGSPRNLDALLVAGRAALDVGDPNAALGFFARAEDVAPRSAEAKAGLGSSLVMIERPDDALRLFAEAIALGGREELVAKDRGLAYDLRGDQPRAQRDYLIALRGGPDDEAIRRFALSLGISGDRDRAMAVLDPLLRKQDQGAWRARAFIFAMTGDVPGANGVARALMPPRMAAAMSPLLTRLATLNAADRARAVTFGTMPSDGTQLAMVQPGDPYLPATVAPGSRLVPAGDPLGPRPGDVVTVRKAEPLSREPRRRPDRQVALVTTPAPKLPVTTASPTPLQSSSATAVVPSPGFSPVLQNGSALTRRVGERIGPVDPARLPPEARGENASIAVLTTRTDLPSPGTDTIVPTPLPELGSREQVARVTPQPSGAPPIVLGPPVLPKPDLPKPAPTKALEVAQAPPAPSPAAAATPVPTLAAAPASRLAGLLAGIDPEPETPAIELPSARELRVARTAAKRKIAELAAQQAAADAARLKKEAELAAAKRNPPRIWIQIATGSNDAGLPTTWQRIRSANEAALKGQSAWSVPYRATNRVLVGPVKSSAVARDLVKALAKGGLQATVYTSEAGEEIAKIAGK